MFLGLDPVLYIWGYLFIVYVTLFRLIVLYSRCRVNRGTSLFVVLYYVIFLLLFCFHCVWAECWAFPTYGVPSPPCRLLHNTCAADARVPRCWVLVGNFVQYILLYIMVVMGASLTLLFNGPTSRNVARYIFGDWCDL